MKSQIRTVILFFLTTVFAVSAFMLVRQMTSYRAGDEAYAEASEIAAIPEVTIIGTTPGDDRSLRSSCIHYVLMLWSGTLLKGGLNIP